MSPAEANTLVVTGAAGETYVDAVWQQIPVPRVKVEIGAVGNTRSALAAAAGELRDPQRQRAVEPMHVEHMPMSTDHGNHEHDHDMHGHDMGGMEMPGGIPMAGRAEDRDGLKLDVLHVSLGPVLVDWPAGLAVHATLQGDVLQEVSVEVIGQARASGYWTADRACARRLDSCARLLAVAGWESAATQARSLRDAVLSGREAGSAFDR